MIGRFGMGELLCTGVLAEQCREALIEKRPEIAESACFDPAIATSRFDQFLSTDVEATKLMAQVRDRRAKELECDCLSEVVLERFHDWARKIVGADYTDYVRLVRSPPLLLIFT